MYKLYRALATRSDLVDRFVERTRRQLLGYFARSDHWQVRRRPLTSLDLKHSQTQDQTKWFLEKLNRTIHYWLENLSFDLLKWKSCLHLATAVSGNHLWSQLGNILNKKAKSSYQPHTTEYCKIISHGRCIGRGDVLQG